MAVTIKNGELRIIDTLNYEVFKNMTPTNRKDMVKWEAKRILNSEVKNPNNNTIHLELPKGDKTEYKTKAEFTIMDFKLNKIGLLNATMLCKRNGDDVDVVVKSITYKEF